MKAVGRGTSISKTSGVIDWSCQARNRRKLELVASDSSQTRITDYHSILNDIERLTIENRTLSDLLRHVNIHEEMPSCSLTPVLKQIISNAEKNAERLPHGRRHPEVLKKFSIALFIYAGPVAYEFLQQNLPQALPSLPTIRRIVHSQLRQ